MHLVEKQTGILKNVYVCVIYEVIDFYFFCNGFDTHLVDSFDVNLISLDDHLYYLKEMNSEEFPLFNSLFPKREDGAGNFDCVVSKKNG